jgi:hypothetical protein
MLNVNSDKQVENEANTIIIYVLGRLDCTKVTLCKQIAEKIVKNSKRKYLIRFEFEIKFETQFDLLKENLIKEDLDFLSFQSSPIIYYKVK